MGDAADDLFDLLPDRIIDKIAFCPVTGCWLWDGWDSGNGYGKVR